MLSLQDMKQEVNIVCIVSHWLNDERRRSEGRNRCWEDHMGSRRPGHPPCQICELPEIRLLYNRTQVQDILPDRFIHGLVALRQILGHVLSRGGIPDLLPESGGGS